MAYAAEEAFEKWIVADPEPVDFISVHVWSEAGLVVVSREHDRFECEKRTCKPKQNPEGSVPADERRSSFWSQAMELLRFPNLSCSAKGERGKSSERHGDSSQQEVQRHRHTQTAQFPLSRGGAQFLGISFRFHQPPPRAWNSAAVSA